jgi:hypothetical protein
MDVASSGSHVLRAGESMVNQFLEFDMVLTASNEHPGQNIHRQEYGTGMLRLTAVRKCTTPVGMYTFIPD